MPNNKYPVRGDRHVQEPTSIPAIQLSARSTDRAGGTSARWRPVGAAAASLAAPISIGIPHPVIGEVIAVIEVVVALTIIATALFGNQTLSERAFRLLRWFGDRPEPPVPGHEHTFDRARAYNRKSEMTYLGSSCQVSRYRVDKHRFR